MTAKPKPMPTTPHELCTRLTELGDAFWIECVQEGDSPAMYDVRCHGPEWVELREVKESGRFFWVRWADLGPFEIVES